MPGQSGRKTTTPDLQFRHAIGKKMREERERKQLRQETVALSGRRWGLPWLANTVAQLETGRRRLLAEEWLLLPVVLTEALNPTHPYTFEDLIPNPIKPQIALTPATRCYSEGLVRLLRQRGVLAHPDVEFFDRPHSRRHQAMTIRSGRSTRGLSEVPDYTETGYRASRVLGVAPTAVATAALRLWQRSLMEERDYRLTKTGQTVLTTRNAQAMKGHVTRTLLQELRPELLKLGLKPTAKRKIPKGEPS